MKNCFFLQHPGFPDYFLVSTGQSQDLWPFLIIPCVFSPECPRRNFSYFRKSSMTAILMSLFIGVLQGFQMLPRFMKLSIQLILTVRKLWLPWWNFHPEPKSWNPQKIFQWPVWEGDMTTQRGTYEKIYLSQVLFWSLVARFWMRYTYPFYIFKDTVIALRII